MFYIFKLWRRRYHKPSSRQCVLSYYVVLAKKKRINYPIPLISALTESEEIKKDSKLWILMAPNMCATIEVAVTE